jgi:hypothetical protein
VRIDGRFAQIRTRALCKTASGVSLVDASAHQPEFALTEVTELGESRQALEDVAPEELSTIWIAI